MDSLKVNKKVKKKPKKKSKKKCPFEGCKRKIQLTNTPCRCGITYCNYHRLPEQHKCTFNYKEGREDLLMKKGLGGGTFQKLTII